MFALRLENQFIMNINVNTTDIQFKQKLEEINGLNNVSVIYNNLNDTQYSFSLIDLHGKIVFKKHIENANLVESVSLDGLSKGLYLGVMQTSTKRITKKILVE